MINKKKLFCNLISYFNFFKYVMTIKIVDDVIN